MYAPIIWIHICTLYKNLYLYQSTDRFFWCDAILLCVRLHDWLFQEKHRVIFDVPGNVEVLDEQQVKQLTGTLTSWSPHSNDGRQINHQMSQHFRRRKRNEGRGQGWRKGFQVEQASFTRKMTVTQGVEGGEDLHCVRMHFWIGRRQDGHFLSQNLFMKVG